MADTFEFKPVNVEFMGVDPEVLAMLTGMEVVDGEFVPVPPDRTFAVEVNYPGRRRTLWEWLRRKPRHYPGGVLIPHATLINTTGDTDG